MDYLIVGFGQLLAPESTWISPAHGFHQPSAPFILLAGLWAEAMTVPYRWSMMVLLDFAIPSRLRGRPTR